MARDFIPRSDEGFDIWQDNFIVGVQPNLSAWGIPTAEFHKLLDLKIT